MSRKYIWKKRQRKIRKNHALRARHHLAWWCISGWIFYFYFTHFEIAQSGSGDLYFIMGLQVIYFYTAVFWLLPIAFRRHYSLLYQVGFILLACLGFMVILIAASIATGNIELDLDFSSGTSIEIVNLGEMLFPYFSLSPLFSLLFFYIERWMLSQRANKRMREWRDRTNTEILLLDREWRAWQMNPHLLSNLLTALREAQRSNNHKHAARIMNYIISLMNFYIRHTKSADTISLKDELRQLKCLLALYRLCGDAYKNKVRHLTIEVAKPVPAVQVLPMLLFNLVENILTHASRIDRTYPARLQISETDGTLSIRAANFHTNGGQQPSDLNLTARHGIALTSIRRRIGLLGPDAQFETVHQNGYFVVHIAIPHPINCTFE